MLNVIKAELFRISKIKTVKVLMVLSIVFALLTNFIFKLDEQGFFGVLSNKVSIVKPLVESDTTIVVDVKEAGEYQFTLVNENSISSPIASVTLKEGENTVQLNTPLSEKSNVVIVKNEDGFVNPTWSVVYRKGEDTSRFKATIEKRQLGFTREFFDYRSLGIIEILTIVLAAMIITGEFTNSRFKNYLHLVNSRTQMLVGKFIAILIAVLFIELVLSFIVSILAIPFFGFGPPLTAKLLTTFAMKWLLILLYATFVVAFVLFFSVLFKGVTAGVVGLYFGKQIALIPLFALFIETTKNWTDGFLKMIHNVVEHVFVYGTASGLSNVIKVGFETGKYGPVFIGLTYTVVYIVLLTFGALVLFRKQEIK